MSTITLRPYQLDALERTRAEFRRGAKSVLYVAPPGSGKTLTFAAICRGAAERGNRVLILCHRAELVEQISRALAETGVGHGFIAANYDYRAREQVYVASVQTLVRRLDLIVPPDLIICDEAHHAAGQNSWAAVFKRFAGARRLGVTASPVRLSGESLAEHFDSLVVGPTYEELIHDGYLSPCKVYAPPTIDTQGLHSRAGDYVTAELEARTGKPHVTGDAIEHYIRHTPGKRAVLFDVSVQAARGRAQAFRDRGFPAACIDGSLEASHRRSLVADFRAGRLTILTSCELISEGFDLPAIEVGISLRPTQSLGLFLQQTGRILRPFPGKSVSVLFDHAGNVHRFGLPTETRSWTLSRSDPRVKRAVFRAGIRICPACFAASPARSMVCSECGAEFASSPRTVVERAGELKEITLSADQLAARRKRQEQGQARTLEALIHLGRRRRLKHPEAWARRLLAARQRSRRT